MVKARIVPINNIISETTNNIESCIDNTGEVNVQINIGKITGITFLSKIGPKINIKMETSRAEWKQILYQNLQKVELIRLCIKFF